jgi:hypothetical protein
MDRESRTHQFYTFYWYGTNKMVTCINLLVAPRKGETFIFTFFSRRKRYKALQLNWFVQLVHSKQRGGSWNAKGIGLFWYCNYAGGGGLWMNTGRDQRNCSGSRPAVGVWPMDDGQCWLTPCVGINHLIICKLLQSLHAAAPCPSRAYGAGRASVRASPAVCAPHDRIWQ